MDITEEIKKLENEISEHEALISMKTSKLNKLRRKQSKTVEEIKKNDPCMGKYYKRVDETITLYHPQEYGTRYSAFDWRNDIVYEGLYCTYTWIGTCGSSFHFDLQQSVHQENLLNDFVEITKEEFEEGVKNFMNDIMEFVKTDKFLPNDKELRKGLYEPAKAKKNWL